MESTGSTWGVLRWLQPTEVGKPGIAFYTVAVRDTSGNSEMFSVSTTGNATRKNITNLLPGIIYQFRVQAVAKILNVEEASAFSGANLGTTSVTGK